MRKIVLSVFAILMLCFQLAAQNQRVTGKVTSLSTSEPLLGATVVVKGTQTAAVTGASGEYTINVPANSTLVFEYLGCAKKEIPVTPGTTVINAQLSEDNQQIEQVVVVGYGSARSVGSVTGSVSVVNAAILNDKPVMNVADALSGQVSGMSVVTSSGEPSASSTIRIHGVGTLTAGSEPLYIIDGMPSSANQFLALNSNDIESMVTLKDASATSIYGSRAANGVIYITTKKGRKQQNASFRFSGQYGISEPVGNKMDLMGASDLLKWANYFGEVTDSEAANYSSLMDRFGGGTDWFSYVFKPVPTYNAEFSVSGGSENVNYYVSGSYMDQQGIAPGSAMSRYTMRANLAAKATSWLDINLNLAASSDQRQATWGSTTSGGLNPTSPTNFPLYTANYFTKYFINEAGDVEQYVQFPNNNVDPYYIMSKAPDKTSNKLLNGNISFVIKPVKGLTITSLNGIDGAYSNTKASSLPSHFASYGQGWTARAFGQYYTLSTSNTIEYRFAPINDVHNITVLVGQEGIENYSDNFSVKSDNQTDDRLMILQNGTSIKIDDISETASSYNMLSFFGRVNYDYKRKYTLDVTVRNDASSRFGKSNRNALFYAVGAMWNIKEESFLKDNPVLTDLKLRVSYGTQGNSAIGNYNHLALISQGTNYAQNVGRYYSSTGNPLLGWEKQSQLNIGIEAGLFNWLELSASYYDRNTTDMLYQVPYPPSSGITSRTENVLSMFNRGVDVDINATLFNNRDWNISFSTTFNYNLNRITSLYKDVTEIPNAPGLTNYKLGGTAWNFYLPIFMGVDPRDGKPLFDDGNGNAVKDYALAANILTDKQYYAPFNGGFNINASWKGISVAANFAYQIDKWILNGDRFWLENTVASPGLTNRTEAMKNIWRKPGQITDIPAFGQSAQVLHSGYLENASYLRLKNLAVSYTMPQSLMKKTGFINSVKFIATFRNLWTLTNYTGYDPEYAGLAAAGTYPNTRQYTFGVEITF